MPQIFPEKIFGHKNGKNNANKWISQVEIIEAKYIEVKLQVFDNEVDCAF